MRHVRLSLWSRLSLVLVVPALAGCATLEGAGTGLNAGCLFGLIAGGNAGCLAGGAIGGLVGGATGAAVDLTHAVKGLATSHLPHRVDRGPLGPDVLTYSPFYRSVSHATASSISPYDATDSRVRQL